METKINRVISGKWNKENSYHPSKVYLNKPFEFIADMYIWTKIQNARKYGGIVITLYKSHMHKRINYLCKYVNCNIVLLSNIVEYY